MDLERYRQLRRSVHTEHGEFSYVEAGEGDPALFVHGLFVSSYMWRGAIEQLAGERRCIAYDLPWHGETRVAPDQELSLPAQVEMLVALCDALGLGAVDLVANDTGGAIAQIFAARHPERVRTLALTNCEARDVVPSPHRLAQAIQGLAERGELAPAAVRMIDDHDLARSEVGLGAGLEHPERLTADDLHGYLEQHYARLENARQVERFVTALDPAHLVAAEPGLRALEAPALVVWGTGDPIFGLELAHWLRDTLPGCDEVVEVEGGKLFWPGERPGELVAPLRRLWARSGAPA